MIYMRGQEKIVIAIYASVSAVIASVYGFGRNYLLRKLSKFKGRKLSKITDLVFGTDDNTNAKMYIKLPLLSK